MTMKAPRALLLLFLPVFLIARPVLAQGHADAVGPAMSQQDSCRNEVSKFEQSIVFVRQNAGQKTASNVRERLLPAKLESDILSKDGYCGLARHLRERKLTDD